MSQFALMVNGQPRIVDADSAMPLLWVLRDLLQMTGTKYGCGIGMCGACTVHLDGEAVRSCQTAVADAQGKRIITIEGLGEGETHFVQDGVDSQITILQCGYCQPGQIAPVRVPAHRTIRSQPMRRLTMR